MVEDLEPEMIAEIDFLNKFSIKLKKETGYNEGVLVIRDTLTDGDRLKRIREIYADKIDEPLMKLLIEYKTIFMADKWDKGKITLTKHKIETQGEPILVKPYRQPKHFEEKLDDIIKNYEENDIIEKCRSPWKKCGTKPDRA